MVEVLCANINVTFSSAAEEEDTRGRCKSYNIDHLHLPHQPFQLC
jgi:hypothetical protein